jgi:hypothetical protein
MNCPICGHEWDVTSVLGWRDRLSNGLEFMWDRLIPLTLRMIL